MARRSGRSGGKILVITLEYLPPHRSGNGVYAEHVVRALRKLGDVRVLTANYGGDVPGHVMPVSMARRAAALQEGIEFSGKSLRAAEGIKGFDLVVGVDWNSAPPAVAVKKREGCPLVWMPFRIFSYSHEEPSVRGMERDAAREADAVLAVSRTDAALVERFFHRKAGVVHPPLSIEGGREMEVFRNKKENYILAVSRVSPEKGIERLIRAMPFVAPELSLVIAGEVRDGPYHRKLKALATGLGVGGRVTFKGRVGREGLARLYSGAAVYVNPSVYEPFGMSIMEAASQALPVVIDGSGMVGAGELLEGGRSCVMVDMNNAEELAEALNALFHDPAMRRRLDMEARKAAEKLSIGAFEDEINNFILGTIDKG